MASPIPIAVLGAGRIGKVHAGNIARHPGARLAAVVDVQESAARSLAEQHGAPVLTSEDVLADAGIPAVFICTATDTHAELIERAAGAGKHIFCEKPIDLSLERVDACLEVVRETGAKLMVGFNRRFDPNVRALHAALQAGEIGKPELLQITSRDPGPPPLEYLRVSGGLFKDMTIHDLDMACFLLGEAPRTVSATAATLVDPDIARAGDVDTAVVTLSFPSGAIAVVTNSRRASYGYDQRLEVHGETGMLQAENVRESTVVKSSAEGVTSQKPLHFFLERYQAAYRAELEAFLRVCRGEAEPAPSGAEGRLALHLAEAAERARRTGCAQAVG